MLLEEKGAVEKLFARSLWIVDRIGFGLSFEDERALMRIVLMLNKCTRRFIIVDANVYSES